MTHYTLSTIASHNVKNRLVGYPTSLQFWSDKQGAGLILDAESEAYAVRNGYNGSLADYIKAQYAGYLSTCQRCGILPMTFIQFCKGG